MRYVGIDRVKPGMRLAKPIYDQADRILLNYGVELNYKFINSLFDRGIMGVYIDDEFSQGININEVISEELRTKAVKTLKDFDIDSSFSISQRIIDQLLTSDTIELDIIDLRTYDDYTYRHSVNVAVLASIIGISMNLPQNKLVELCLAALLHDIGKLKIDPEIINKPAQLTEEEYDLVKTHPNIAYDILNARYDISSTVKIGILLHHENYDGTGYPMGVSGTGIHPYARIIHVADVYDALSSKRPYKDPYSPSESVEYLMGGGGTNFDREIVDIFLNYVPIYPKGTMVALSDGREAVVVENYKHNVLRPKIRTEDGEEIDLSTDADTRNLTILNTIM